MSNNIELVLVPRVPTIEMIDAGDDRQFGNGPDIVGHIWQMMIAAAPKPSTDVVDRLDAARDFPANTCPASRHVQMIGEALMAGERYAMIEEDPAYVGEALLSVVASLYEARTQLSTLQDALRGLLRCEFESAGHGLYDCIDNAGKPYQSADLAKQISNAESALSSKGESNG